MGGIWFDTLVPDAPPILWRQKFSTSVSAALVTSDNPHGTISISDLELTGVLAHKAVLANLRDVRERTMWIGSDNRAAVSWATKGSATSLAARSYLLRVNALHQRAHRYVARHHYIPGIVNTMADDASRRWDLSDIELLSHFNLTFPQNASWQLQTLPSDMHTILTGALSRKRVALASLTNDRAPLPPPGSCGRPSVPAWESSPSARPERIRSLFSNCLPNDTGQAPLPPAAASSDLARWRTPYEPWARRTPGWGPRILV